MRVKTSSCTRPWAACSALLRQTSCLCSRGARGPRRRRHVETPRAIVLVERRRGEPIGPGPPSRVEVFERDVTEGGVDPVAARLRCLLVGKVPLGVDLPPERLGPLDARRIAVSSHVGPLTTPATGTDPLALGDVPPAAGWRRPRPPWRRTWAAMVRALGISAVARELGVSRQAVRDRVLRIERGA